MTSIRPASAAGRGQYSKALRLYLEKMTAQEIQYGALVKTFKVVGLHLPRVVWCVEQRLMKAT